MKDYKTVIQEAFEEAEEQGMEFDEACEYAKAAQADYFAGLVDLAMEEAKERKL